MTDQALARAIEESLFLLPVVPDLVGRLDVADVHARTAPVSDPFANRVGLATLPDADVAETVRRLCRAYGREGKTFDWVVGPSTQPVGLGRYLEENGFTKRFETAGMVLDDLAHLPSRTPRFRVRIATADDLGGAASVFAAGFGWPSVMAEWFVQAHWQTRDQLRSRLYIAADLASGEDVAAAFLTRPDQAGPVALGGAATVPAHRGQGAYRDLVMQRLLDARELGGTVAVLSALRTTSAPIVNDLGFREVATLEFFLWRPNASSAQHPRTTS